LTQTGGTFARFVDYEGYYTVEWVQYIQGTELLYRRESNHSMLEYHLDLDEKEQIIENNLAYAAKSPTERNILAASTQEVYIDLKPWWEKIAATYLKTGLIGTPIRLKIKIRALNDLVQTDGTAVSCTLNDITILSDTFSVMSNEKAYHLAESLKQGGKHYRVNEWQFQDEILDTGASSFKIKLDNFTLPACRLQFFLIDTANEVRIPPNPTNTYTTFVPVYRYKMTAGQDDVTRWTYDREGVYILGGRNMAYPGARIYSIPWSLKPGDARICSGHKTPARMNNPLLLLEFAGILTSPLHLYIFTDTNNIVTQTGASFKRILN